MSPHPTPIVSRIKSKVSSWIPDIYMSFSHFLLCMAQKLKCLPAMQETWVRSLGWEDPGEGNGNLFQYSCLENPMDGVAWWATLHGVAKSRTRLSDFTFTFTVSLQSLLLQLLLCFFIHKGLQSISRTVKLIYSLFISMS